MDSQNNNGANPYYLYVGLQLSASSVFFEVQDQDCASALCKLFNREYGSNDFQYAPLNGDSVADEILLTEALDDLRLYDDPDPGVYDTPPPQELLDRAQFARRAAVWHELLQRRRDRGRQAPDSRQPQDEPAGDSDELPNIDDIPPMPPEDDRNSGLILLLMMAQAYYTMVESAVSMASWVTMLDMELNHSYLWTVQNLTNLLKNHKHLQDFPDTFEPVLPDLYPSTIGDLEWQDMVAPDVEGFLATVQKYVMSKGTYDPEEGSPAWVMVELFRPSIMRAVECADKYNKRMRAAQRRILEQPGQPEQTQQKPAPPPEAPRAAIFSTPKGASWADVRMRFIDGETLAIKVGQTSGRFLFSEMGMVDGRNKKPTKQWDLLRTFADNHGIVTWDLPGADRRNQKRKELLVDQLKAFFSIDGEPIVLTDDKKGWRTVFSISDE